MNGKIESNWLKASKNNKNKENKRKQKIHVSLCTIKNGYCHTTKRKSNVSSCGLSNKWNRDFFFCCFMFLTENQLNSNEKFSFYSNLIFNTSY